MGALSVCWPRLDRAITLSLVSPMMRAGLLRKRQAIPILMYHAISDDPERGRLAYFKTKTSRRVFAEHMQFLHDQGYRGLDVGAALNSLAAGHPASGKPVVITFDDGFRDFLTDAFPILKRHGFTATVFLPTGFIGESPISFLGRDCLTWSEVRDLRAEGITFGSHTRRHPRLVDLSWKEIKEELAGSKAEIEGRLGEPVRWFAFPYAFPREDRAFVSRLEVVLRELGYGGCATTEIGRQEAVRDPFYLKRLPNNNEDDSKLFRAKLEGAYDWLRLAQRLVKLVKLAKRRFVFPGICQGIAPV